MQEWNYFDWRGEWVHLKGHSSDLLLHSNSTSCKTKAVLEKKNKKQAVTNYLDAVRNIDPDSDALTAVLNNYQIRKHPDIKHFKYC